MDLRYNIFQKISAIIVITLTITLVVFHIVISVKSQNLKVKEAAIRCFDIEGASKDAIQQCAEFMKEEFIFRFSEIDSSK